MELAGYFWTLGQLEKLQRSRVPAKNYFPAAVVVYRLQLGPHGRSPFARDASPANRQKQLDLLI